MDSREIRTLKELIEVCTLPPLVQDVEDHPIDRDNFEEFRKSLEINLPLVLDHLSSQDVILELNNDDDCDMVQLRLQLIMLLCEQAPNGQPFGVNSESIWNALKERSCSYLTPELLTKCLGVYKEQLNKDKWKRNLGPAWGFVYFAKLHLKQIQPDLATTLFILAIASQFIECIHAEIKQLALSLYRLILSKCPKTLILEANVNKVIISICLQNSQKLLKDDCLISLWDNVKEAVVMDDRIIRELNWNELDDGLQLLFQRIKLEADRQSRERLRRILLDIIIRCCPDPLDYRQIKEQTKRHENRKIENVKLFRWIGDLKELFIFECLSVSNLVESTKNALEFIIQSYWNVIYGLPYDLIGSQLEDLLKRIMPLLMEIASIYRGNTEVTQDLGLLLSTFQAHLDMINPIAERQSNNHKALQLFLRNPNHLVVNLTQNG